MLFNHTLESLILTDDDIRYPFYSITAKERSLLNSYKSENEHISNFCDNLSKEEAEEFILTFILLVLESESR